MRTRLPHRVILTDHVVDQAFLKFRSSMGDLDWLTARRRLTAAVGQSELMDAQSVVIGQTYRRGTFHQPGCPPADMIFACKYGDDQDLLVITVLPEEELYQNGAYRRGD